MRHFDEQCFTWPLGLCPLSVPAFSLKPRVQLPAACVCSQSEPTQHNSVPPPPRLTEHKVSNVKRKCFISSITLRNWNLLQSPVIDFEQMLTLPFAQLTHLLSDRSHIESYKKQLE